MRYVTLLLLMAALGCQIDHSFVPPNAVRMGPPPVPVDSLWLAMERCSAHFGNVQRIEWYHVQSDVYYYTDGLPHDGMWREPHEIYLTDNGLGSNFVIAHEMLHDLLQTGAHPPVFGKCGV